MSTTPHEWLASWDAQQSTYIPSRDRRFEIMSSIVAAAGPSPRVLDLGCGPGSLLLRLQQSLPAATLVGLDYDPVLLSIARSVFPHGRPAPVLLDIDLHDPAWPVVARRHGPFDVIVSATALHWLPPEALRATYAAAQQLLRPGGWLLNGDTMPLTHGSSIGHHLQPPPDSPTRSAWEDWWDRVTSSDAFKSESQERVRRRASAVPTADFMPAEDWHLDALALAGLAETAVIWRDGQEAVVAGRRPDHSATTPLEGTT